MKLRILALVLGGAVAFSAAAEAGGYKEGKVKNGGTISGTVKYTGKAPAPKTTGKDEGACHATTPDPTISTKDGKLANVLVFLKKVKKGKPFTDAQKKVVADQAACIFVPHVALVAEGGEVEFKNSDTVLHNVKGNSIRNGQFNEGVEAKKSLKKTFKKGHDVIQVSCSVHAWMVSYVVVMPHPYYAVTDAQGNFKLEDVPAGKYNVIVWHGSKKTECEVSVDGKSASKQSAAGVKVKVKKGKEVKIEATFN